MTPQEREALVKVRDMLASGAIEHAPMPDIAKVERGFNMNYPQTVTKCGTACCIGGWMARELGKDGYDLRAFVSFCGKDEDLRDLFYPEDADVEDWDDITPAQAVKAIDNFLADGNPRWSEVVS